MASSNLTLPNYEANSRQKEIDLEYLKKAYLLALKAYNQAEIPVGAIIVRQGKIIGRGYNQKEKKNNCLKHAELIAIKQAMKKIADWRLIDATLYTTLEPCPMCAGAILHARIKRVVFGAWDLKWGVAGSIINLFQEKKFNHQTICEFLNYPPSTKILKDFFKDIRAKKNK